MLMFVKLTLFLIILSNYSFAQIIGERSPTKFDKFIKHKKIQWAAYANDTLHFDKYNLTGELIKGFENKKIKFSLPICRDSLIAGKKIIYISKKDFEQRSYAPGLFDELHNIQRPTNRVDSNSYLMNVEEILYVENAKLNAYILWVSPKISVYTSNDRFLGTSEYFSSSINYNYKFRSSKRDKVIFITTTKRKFLLDDFSRADRLKELYGISMLDAIWKDLMNDKNEFTNLRNGEKVPLNTLVQYSYGNSITIPLYDSVGHVTGRQSYSEPISPSLFPQIEVTQNWFYNSTKNIITNNISDITLFIKSQDDLAKLIPVLKITFK